MSKTNCKKKTVFSTFVISFFGAGAGGYQLKLEYYFK